MAASARMIIEKGTAISPQGQSFKLRCTVHDIKVAGSPEQLGALEEFISIWAPPEEPAEKPVKAPKPPPAATRKKK